MSNISDKVGIVLSGASTSEAAFQPLESWENMVIEGQLVIVDCPRNNTEILGRIGSIIPYNAFYAEGDAFSEARRKGMSIPGDIAKQYSVCKVDLLQELSGGPSRAVTFPPHPGDSVRLYDPKLHEKKLFGMARNEGDDKVVWFATQKGYTDAPIALNIENMPMHCAIFGVTGSGKSYNMGALLECFSEIPFTTANKERVRLSYPMIIIDANGDYSDYAENNQTQQIGSYGMGDIKRVYFPISYKTKQALQSGDSSIQKLVINLNELSSRDLSEIIMEYYHGSGGDVNEHQVAGLQLILERLGPDGAGNSFQDLLKWPPDLILSGGRELWEDIHDQTARAIRRAVRSFSDNIDKKNQLLSDANAPWFNINECIEQLTKGKVAIFDFSADGAPGIELTIKQFVIGYLSTVLFNKFTLYKQEMEEGTRYLSYVIEEAQNFCPGRRYPIGSSLAKTKLSAIATQGRKFGLSLCLVSQRPSFVDEIVLSMCNTFFIHRISPEDVNFVRGVTGGLPESLSRKLTTLSQGECIVTGQMNCVPFPMLVKVPEREVQHTAGKTDVVRRIAQIRNL